MAKEEPLDEALYEIKNIIGMLQANLFKMVNTKEVKESEELLNQVENAIATFERQAIDELKNVGLTQQQKDMLEDGVIPNNIQGEYRETLEIALGLKKQIDELRNIALKEQGRIDEAEEFEEPTDKKTKDGRITKQQHKKKFKRLGGDNWKPL